MAYLEFQPPAYVAAHPGEIKGYDKKDFPHFPKTVPAGNYSGIAWLGGDIEASLVEATAIMSRLLSNEAFMKQLSKAKEEYQKRSVATSSSGG